MNMKIKGIEAVTPYGVKVECELEDIGDGNRRIVSVHAQGEHSDDAWLYLIGSVVRIEEVSCAMAMNGKVRINKSERQVMAMIDDFAVITSVRCMVEFTHERDARIDAYERG